MHIAYLDDSGSDAPSPVTVVTAVLISPDVEFRKIGASVGFVIQDLLPEKEWDAFDEFKGCELYRGLPPFKAIDDKVRLDAIHSLLSVVNNFKLPIIYSVVNKKELGRRAVGGANPVDVAFRMCARGVEQWMTENDPEGLGLLIMDDTKDGRLKHDLNSSFRMMRSSLRPPYKESDLWHIHDDMYFGDSRFSFGLQLADLCGFFIKLHTCCNEGYVFYSLISQHLICAKVEPDWSQLKGVFVEAGQLNI